MSNSAAYANKLRREFGQLSHAEKNAIETKTQKYRHKQNGRVKRLTRRAKVIEISGLESENKLTFLQMNY